MAFSVFVSHSMRPHDLPLLRGVCEHLSHHGISYYLAERDWRFGERLPQAMMNWITRRKSYLLARWLWLPSSVANKVSNVVKKLFCKDWDPLQDPVKASQRFYDELPGGIPIRKDKMPLPSREADSVLV